MKITTKHNAASRKDGFTLVELLMAMLVMSIILAAVATMASAMSNANRETKDMGEKQAQIRYTTMRLTELINNASLIVPVSNPRIGFCVWTDSDEDGQPDGTELVYIEVDIPIAKTSAIYAADSTSYKSIGESSIGMLEFTAQNDFFWINSIEIGTARSHCLSYGTSRYTTIIPECSDVQILVDIDRKFASLKFTVTEAGVDHQYEIAATRMCSADNYLNDAGELVSPFVDDD